MSFALPGRVTYESCTADLAFDEPTGTGLWSIYLGVLARVLEALVPAEV